MISELAKKGENGNGKRDNTTEEEIRL